MDYANRSVRPLKSGELETARCISAKVPLYMGFQRGEKGGIVYMGGGAVLLLLYIFRYVCNRLAAQARKLYRKS